MATVWTEDKVQTLIGLFKEKPVLWSPRHKDYRSRSRKMEAMREMAEEMDIEMIEIERKLHILVTQFRRTHRKVLGMKRAGLGDDAEKNIWYGYKALAFLGDRFDAAMMKSEPQEFVDAESSSLSEPYQEEIVLMKDPTEKSVFKDEYDLYGEQIALKLKKMDPMTRLETQHKINCILHDAEMGILHNMYDGGAISSPEKRFKSS